MVDKEEEDFFLKSVTSSCMLLIQTLVDKARGSGDTEWSNIWTGPQSSE